MLCSHPRHTVGRASIHSVTLPPRRLLYLGWVSLATILSWLGLDSSTVGACIWNLALWALTTLDHTTGSCWGPFLPCMPPKPEGILHFTSTSEWTCPVCPSHAKDPRQAGLTSAFLLNLMWYSSHSPSTQPEVQCTIKITHGTLADVQPAAIHTHV